MLKIKSLAIKHINKQHLLNEQLNNVENIDFNNHKKNEMDIAQQVKLEPVDIREIDEESMTFTLNDHDSGDEEDDKNYEDFKNNFFNLDGLHKKKKNIFERSNSEKQLHIDKLRSTDELQTQTDQQKDKNEIGNGAIEEYEKSKNRKVVDDDVLEART